MYERYFHLVARPFAMNPDPRFLYLSPQHASALTLLEYSIESQASFCMLTGAIGSGKTTVIRQLIASLGESIKVGLISNCHSRFESVIPWALSALNIVAANDSYIAQYEALTDSVIRQYAAGRRTLLILDEAQNLPVVVLEELRLISNINSEQDVALQILLVGQPELCATLERPELTQFAQRVSLAYHLDSLSESEAHFYIQHRLSVAGGDKNLFDADAIRYIHGRSAGIPRLINQLCDMALVYAYADKCQSIGQELVRQVIDERNRGRGTRVFVEEPQSTSLAGSSHHESERTLKLL